MNSKIIIELFHTAKLQENLELTICFCNSDCFLSFHENIIKSQRMEPDLQFRTCKNIGWK